MDTEEIKSLAKKQFGREAKKYVSSLVHSSKTDLQFVHDFIDPKGHWTVLDIATGAGHLALNLAPVVNSVIASDITPEMLDEAEQLAKDRGVTNFITEVIDVHSIPYPDDHFDLVGSRIAPHHFHQVEKAIEEMARVCKSEGYIFIQDTVAPENSEAARFFNQIEKLRDPSHFRDLSPPEWIELLQEQGCKLIRWSTKSKDWPLKWWTERMSTPKENVIEIIQILENIYDTFRDDIHIKRAEGYQQLALDFSNYHEVLTQWSMHPHNGYFLAQKQ